MSRLLCLIVVLIIYGSLYPFSFQHSPSVPNAWGEFLADRRLWTSRGDVFGNALLFAPFGVAAMLATNRVSAKAKRVLTVLACGTGLAFLLQVVQLWIPVRSASLADVVWNVIGTSLGVGISLALPDRRERHHELTIHERWAVAFLILWIVVELAPFVPTFSWSLIKANLRPLIFEPTISPVRVMVNAAVVLLIGYLIQCLPAIRKPTLVFVGLLALVNLLRPFVVRYPIGLSTLLGATAGVIVWLSIYRNSAMRQTGVVFSVLLVTYTAAALAPFSFQYTPNDFRWIPFEPLLEGSMMANTQALAESALFFGGMLILVARQGGSALAVGVCLAVWAGALEVVQIWLPGRNANITEPLIPLLLGILLHRRRSERNNSRHHMTGLPPQRPRV
jgi:VanZ family protein